MITKLENSNEQIANRIHAIFQNSYGVEAELIGAPNLPPLLRTARDIASSKTDFYGFTDNDSLAAIIETLVEDKHLEIHSLTVDPTHFRKGIAGKLLNYVLAELDFTEAKVETAAANIPAINLYMKHGFVELNKWTPSHGIEKIAMSLQAP